jgi:hypothetical protein
MGPEDFLVSEHDESGQSGDGRAVMRRFPHGVTTRPLPARPTNGYGRSLRPGPDVMRARRLLVADRRTGEPRPVGERGV